MKIEITEMTLNDCREVWEIENACFSDPWSEKLFTEQIGNPNAKILIAKSNDKIVGFINLWFVAGELTINNIAVLQQFRHLGIGEMLLRKGIGAFPNVECVLLEVRASNLAAQKLYKKLGFVQVGLRKNYYKSPIEDAWLMTLILGDKTE